LTVSTKAPAYSGELTQLDGEPEFTGNAMFFWSSKAAVKLHFIQTGRPTQNAFVESFNGRIREYCLDLH